MRDAGNVAEVAALRPDYMGFIFHARSPRSAFGIDPLIVRSLPERITPVAVSVNSAECFLIDTVAQYGITTLQLHGDETPEECESLRSKGFTVWKCIRVNGETDFSQYAPYIESVDMFLLDTATPSGGGSGKKFDWSKLMEYNLPVPFMLAGGIGPEDASDILKIKHPKFAGIDLNSRFETAPGLKDAAVIRKFMEEFTKF